MKPPPGKPGRPKSGKTKAEKAAEKRERERERRERERVQREQEEAREAAALQSKVDATTELVVMLHVFLSWYLPPPATGYDMKLLRDCWRPIIEQYAGELPPWFLAILGTAIYVLPRLFARKWKPKGGEWPKGMVDPSQMMVAAMETLRQQLPPAQPAATPPAEAA